MKADIAGKLRNAEVPKSRPLLPVFEAIVNSFQSIEARNTNHGLIEIVLTRIPTLVENPTSEIKSVTIRDNGAGFNEHNFRHFLIADTLHKVAIGGKGIGRFTWLNVFHSANITSVYQEGSNRLCRTFTFSVDDDPEENAQLSEAPELSGLLTEVTLANLRTEFATIFPVDADVIAQQIVEHCFLLLIKPDCPKVKLLDGPQEFDLNEYCAEYALDRVFRKSFRVERKSFEYLGLRKTELSTGERTEHKLHIAAHGRPVRTVNLRSCVPNLKGHTVDSNNEPFSYTAYVTGDLLDSTVNQNRTDFSLCKTVSEKLQQESLFPEASIEEIQERALELLNEDLKETLELLNAKKIEKLEALVAKLPEYRPLLKYSSEFIDRIPPGSGTGEIEKILGDEQHKRKVRMRDESRRVLRQFNKASIEEQQENVQRIMEQITDLEKSALAEWSASRK